MLFERCCDGGEGQPLRKSVCGVDALHFSPLFHACIRLELYILKIFKGPRCALSGSESTQLKSFEVGYGMKCGTLVPFEKETGLPLRGTMPLMPLAPGDVMEEPLELEEHEEPNPIQDEAESDKEEVDVDPEQ